MLERKFKRYSAFFRGWCQAFGEHEGVHCKASGVDWLLADHQVGLVLPKTMIKPLHREVLLHQRTPTLTFSDRRIQVGSLEIELGQRQEQKTLDAIENVLSSKQQLHLFLTSHFYYGSGNRIITFSSKRPVPIIYKEIGTMQVRLRQG